MPYAPIIGISAYNSDTPSAQAIMTQIRGVGGEVMLFTDHAARSPETDIHRLDALILMGNDLDIDPSLYITRYPKDDPRRAFHPETQSELATPEGRARAAYEEAMITLCVERKMPLMGICGGMQRINVRLGGTLHQHVPDLVGHEKHCQHKLGIHPTQPVVPVLIEGGTTLAQIARDIPMSFTTSHSPHQPKVIHENSIHHQAVDQIAPGLKVCALTDGIRFANGQQGFLIKAFEADPEGSYAKQCIIGIQWHPEFGASSLGERLAHYFIQQALAFDSDYK